ASPPAEALLEDALDEGVELLERAVVHVGEVGAPRLLLVREQPRRALRDGRRRAGSPHLLRRRDHDDGVEARVGARLVEQWHLDDADLGLEALAPGDEV